MKKFLAIAFCVVFSNALPAQSYRVTWGDEIKLKKGTTDIDIIAADNTGLYFTEARLKMKSYFVIGASYGNAYKLYKLDKNLNPVFDKEYKKELKGYEFHSFQKLENDLFLFVTDYIKKEKLFKVFAAKLDRNTGDVAGDFVEFGSYKLESKRDDYEMKVTSIQNGKAFLTVANISGKEKVSLGVSVLDKSLKKKENAVIDLDIDPERYSLQDVQLTKNNRIVVLGKEFEEVQVKKRKSRLIFKQYTMAIYNNVGQLEHYVNMNSGDKFVIEGKLIESPSGELFLGGFYSNAYKKNDLNGFFINKIDPERGELKLSAYKEINTSMLGKSFEDPSDEDDEMKESRKDKQKAKDDDDQEEFPNSFLIKSVDIAADNSIIITSEISQYSYYTYRTSSYNSTTRSYTYTTNYIHRFSNKDILVISADPDGNIKWVNDLPKSQVEEIRTSNTSATYNYYYSDYSGYFANGGGMPYYSSYAKVLTNNSLVLLINDHTSNNVAASYGDKVKTVSNFKKRSSTFGVAIDLATGKMTKKFIAENNSDMILTPRHALVVGNEIFVPSWRMHALAKTELKFAKISVKM